MKKYLFLAAFAAASLLASCNNNELTPERSSAIKGEKCLLDVSLGGTPVTRATGIKDSDEAKVNHWQIWVFNSDGSLDNYADISDGSTSTTLAVTSGTKDIQVVVNAPSSDAAILQGKSLAEIGSYVSDLTDNSKGSYVMVGKTSETLPKTGTVTINVDRIAARVVIKKITNALTSGQSMKVEALYVTNVAGDCPLGLSSSYSVSSWYNKEGYFEPADANKLSSDFVIDSPAATVDNGASYTTEHMFYVYPNASAPKDGGTWSARASKFVLKVTVGSQVYYYPVQLPEIKNNHSYEINELVITRGGNKPGDADPEDSVITSEDASFAIDVQDWETVLVNGNGIVTI